VKRRVLVVIVALLAASLGVWLYENASIGKLRREFAPWMERLVRWRNAIEDVQRRLKTRDAAPGDPAGMAALRDWAWRDVARLGYVSYRVEKPEHEIGPGREKTSGRVIFTFGGFRQDGARLERSAAVRVTFEKIGASPPKISLGTLIPLVVRTEPQPRFHDATAEAGLGAVRNDPPVRATNRLISDIWPGSGVAVLDYNRDGAEDLFVADGIRSILYENDGRGHFRDVTKAAGLEGVAGTGVAAGDVDGDGFPDLFVTNAFGEARLFRNRGDGTFEDFTAPSGIRVGANARSAVFADFTGNGSLDLAVAVTGDYYSQMPDPPFDANDGRRNYLYKNDGKGHFTDVTKAWGLGGVTRWSLSALPADYDGDGRTDLLFTNDFGLKNLYRNDGGRRFADVTGKAGVEARAYGMSGAFADFDGDGRLDLYTTGTDTQWYFLHEYPWLPVPLPGRIFLPIAIRWMEQMATGNSLFLQNPDHTFRDATESSGARRAGWNWSVVAADLDNDGWPDIYATNGMWGDGRDRDVELEFWWDSLAYWDDYVKGTRTFDRKGAGIAGMERDRYFHNRGGARAGAPLFEDRAFLDGLDLTSNGRAVVAFDANGDGALDLYVRSVGSPEAIYFGTRRFDEHFLRLRLSGTPGVDNRDGIGCRVTAKLRGGRTILLETDNASGYLASGSPIAHLGLGRATRVESLTVRWPSGKVQELGTIEAVDRTLTVDEAKGILRAK
jgi:hypothetical protein